MLTTEAKQNLKKVIWTVVLFLIANLLFFLTNWLLEQYDHVYFDQFLYQMKSSAAGVHRVLTSSVIVRVGLFGFALTAVETAVFLFLTGYVPKLLSKWKPYIQYCSSRVCRVFRKTVLPVALACSIASCTLFIVKLEVVAYVDYTLTESDFIEKHYADPATTSLKFPETKRNLIYIFLESMENTFADPSAKGPITTDFIPELSALANENVSFSHTSGVGGAFTYCGTTWTAGALVSQTSGVPIKVPLDAEYYGNEGSYMPGVVSIGDILKEQGYRQTFIMGSNAEFACRDNYFKIHGDYKMLDTNSLKASGRLPEDYDEWWGFEDEKLFAYAKEELTEYAKSEQPFNLTLLTADTHFPDGYACPQCENTHDNQYANVLSCSSKRVADFISWVKEQPFYENTTIVLAGDHLTMDPKFLDGIDEDYVRTTYNCIINSAVEPVQKQNRTFATFDLFPTTLAAMGVEIEGDRLGLGTNLFSDKPTLTEEYGFDALDTELQKKSEFYNTKFFQEK